MRTVQEAAKLKYTLSNKGRTRKMTREIDTNKVKLIGKFLGGFTFSHEVRGEKFYLTSMEVKRLSDKADIIPLSVSERILDATDDCDGRIAEVSGQFRSFNKHEGDKNRLMLSVFVREINFMEEFTDFSQNNFISLEGHICKPPVYRQTPFGRDIADILLAVNRPYGKADYIPCIAWGRNAEYASTLDVGTCLKVSGRIQSREYQKHISETETETRTAYEVSISKLDLVL